MNIDNINATIETIKHNQKLSFFMGDWIGNYEDLTTPENECGTACCLAGYAAITKNGGEVDFHQDVYEDAKTFLGLDDDTADALFVPGRGYIDETDKDVAISVLEHLRDTGGILWQTLPDKRKL